MNSHNSNNRWSAFTDEELRILSSALYCSAQYTAIISQPKLLEKEILKELANRRHGVNLSGTNY